MSAQTLSLAPSDSVLSRMVVVQAPRVGALPTRQCIAYALAWQATAFAWMTAQFFLMCALGPAAILPSLIALPLLLRYRPLGGITVFFQVLLYQNLFLSFVCGFGMDPSSFQAAQALSFAVVCGMAAISIMRLIRENATGGRAAKLVRLVCISLAVAIIYTVYGMTASSSASALNNFRNTAAMFLALVIGVDVGRFWGYRTVAVIFLTTIAIGLILAVIEYVAPIAYYTAIHARDYTHMRAPPGTDVPEISRSVEEIVKARVVTWFNVTGGAGDALSVRILGPNMWPISYSYVIACTGIVGATLGRASIIGVAICFLVAGGVKGPLIMLAMTIVLTTFWWLTRQRLLMIYSSAALLIAYVVLAIAIGQSNGDFHVIGLLGGWHGFLNKPWGHGIGVGGNLSISSLPEGIDWQAWQKEGADFAVESAVGVLIYQMGVAAIAVYTPLIAILRIGFGRPRDQSLPLARRAPPLPTDALFIGIVVTLVNGFFQEEAYSPYALGLLALLGGVAAGNAMRASPRHGEIRG